MRELAGSKLTNLSVLSADNDATDVEVPSESCFEDKSFSTQMERSSSEFVETMTFTSVQPSCDCDECCRIDVRSTKLSQLPKYFRSALKEYKRQKLTEMPMKRSQLRELLGRSIGTENVAVWQWTMPPSAEPLVEFVNPLIHRLVWIQRLNRRSILKHVGSGILGSLAEEKERKQLNWFEDDVILVSSDELKSIGYIVENVVFSSSTSKCDDNKLDATEIVGPCVMFVAKVYLEQVTDWDKFVDENWSDGDNNSSTSPFERIRRLAIRSIRSRNAIAQAGYSQIGTKIDNTDKELFRQIILGMVSKT